MTCGSCNAELEPEASFCGLCGRRTRTRRDSTIGTLIDNTYRIDEKLAAGGFGAIYRATHLPSGASLALKVLHADFAGEPSLAGRFLRESKALSRLRSPHTIVTYERGEARDGTLYIAMELLRGESLEQRMNHRAHALVRGLFRDWTAGVNVDRVAEVRRLAREDRSSGCGIPRGFHCRHLLDRPRARSAAAR